MSNSLLWYTSRGGGAVSLVLLSAVVVLGVLSVARFEARGWPRFLTTGLHRNLSMVAAIFLVLHIVTAVVDPFTNLGWVAALVPFGSGYRTFWLGLGTLAAELIAAIVVTSLLRRLLGQGAWRLVHWLAYASWPVAVAHGWGTGTDSGAAWMRGIYAGCLMAVAIAVAVRFLVRPPDPLAEQRAQLRREVQRNLRG